MDFESMYSVPQYRFASGWPYNFTVITIILYLMFFAYLSLKCQFNINVSTQILLLFTPGDSQASSACSALILGVVSGYVLFFLLDMKIENR